MKIETWASIRHLFTSKNSPKKLIARKLGLDPKTSPPGPKTRDLLPGHAVPRGLQARRLQG